MAKHDRPFVEVTFWLPLQWLLWLYLLKPEQKQWVWQQMHRVVMPEEDK